MTDFNEKIRVKLRKVVRAVIELDEYMGYYGITQSEKIDLVVVPKGENWWFKITSDNDRPIYIFTMSAEAIENNFVFSDGKINPHIKKSLRKFEEILKKGLCFSRFSGSN